MKVKGVQQPKIGNKNKNGSAANTPQTKIPFGLFIATTADVFIDGLVVGIGFTAGTEQGILLVVALTLELASLGLSLAAELSKQEVSKRRIIMLMSGLGMLIIIGAVLGSVLFQGSSQTILTLGFAFALIAVLYLVIEELMMEAHKSFEDLWEPSILFTEFGVYYIITHLLG